MEIPSITTSSYVTNAIDPTLGQKDFLQAAVGKMPGPDAGNLLRAFERHNQQPSQPPLKIGPTMSTTARIVKVFIADANDNLPLDKRVLHTGTEKLTDLTDQELFFEVPISEILAKHNEVRKATVDKKASEKFGRDIFLEPARIRDLKMVVVTVAQF